MPTIVDFPTIVKDAVDVFGDLFANEPARRHFAEYLTGLMVAEKKTVSGITGAFVVTTDQSCLNRWLNEVTWDVKALNDRRLEWLQGDPKTRYSPRGVIAIDNTLVDHAGKLIEDVGWFWDHANERYIIAHDYMISNYVCPSGAHYPIEWRRFKKKDACRPWHAKFPGRPKNRYAWATDDTGTSVSRCGFLMSHIPYGLSCFGRSATMQRRAKPW